MSEVNLPDAVALKADEVFDGLTEQEGEILRMRSLGYPYADIAVAMDLSDSAARSCIARIVKKKAMPIERAIYLVGIHDARTHARASGKDTVHVVVSRGTDIRNIEI